MAVALNKPLLLVCDPDWPNAVKRDVTEFARITKAQVWTTNDPPPRSVRVLAEDAKEHFLNEFVKDPSCPDKPFWELVADEIVR